ncbi:hypothetical protein WICANDRAFT_66295 [Wickerhamomyces anomalus NRRL Y-366-8]|uniref:INO80 complex subunit B-like conserved region domain-containing protein n=1 Tax=Wickerhamomyces anomalus (strain ATCC 58044 / CBS 1984 / NCYC 433 / NRRL Y-366-8) TaxID=683960 RepID=A0A1E3P9T0_WICAA|nr:uncharacterized protein WICANDRAFT_66295 [Wickerhamomyces anomalus NRRL Y-366-8]ODQ61964.1 hypothetical protein WICANDRAFT_66295 [Wickerhamomyces anomalus NRRL Y-366-8]
MVSVESDAEINEGKSVAQVKTAGNEEGFDDSIDDSVDEDDEEDEDNDNEDQGEEEDDDDEVDVEEDDGVGADEDELDEDDEEDEFASDAQEDDDDQALSDDDDDANFKINDVDDDDVDEPEDELQTPVPQKKRSLSLKIKLPTSKRERNPIKDDLDDDFDDEIEVKKPKKARKITQTKPDPPVSKRGVGRPKRVATNDVNYDDEDDIVSDSENVIPTPALDDELLLTDEETEYTPDVTKMTERQRAKLENEETGVTQLQDQQLLSLSNDVHKRRVLTDEENQLRKAEIARKRKNLTERKLEEEKQETINKLLKRRAGKVSAATLKEDEEVNLKEKPRRPQIQHEALFTWVSKKDTLALRVPEPLMD